MTKFFGQICFVISGEVSPGVFKELETIREYMGDELGVGSRWQSGDKIHDGVAITNRISVLNDSADYFKFHRIRWVEWLGHRWTVESISAEWPRVILSLGGIYNADTE